MSTPSNDLPVAVDTHGTGRILGFAPATLHTMRSRGNDPPYVRMGRAIRYRVANLEVWVTARTVTPDDA